MRCGFSLRHYRLILKSALRHGYAFRAFDKQVSLSSKVIFLRHDLDISPLEAVELAKVEASLGISATYFVLLNSPLYNLFEDKFVKCIYKLVESGHHVGLHVDLPESLTDRFKSVDQLVDLLYKSFSPFFPIENVVSFHRPGSQVLNKTIKNYTSTYEPRFFSESKYLSDSRKKWREGCPCRLLKEEKYRNLQLVVHPVWWGTGRSLDELGRQILNSRNKDIFNYLISNVTPFSVLEGPTKEVS